MISRGHIGGVAILALLVVAYFTTRSRLGAATGSKIKSLAVLPLKILSGDQTQEYLADGMTEALISRLSSIHDLRVISRTNRQLSGATVMGTSRRLCLWDRP